MNLLISDEDILAVENILLEILREDGNFVKRVHGGLELNYSDELNGLINRVRSNSLLSIFDCSVIRVGMTSSSIGIQSVLSWMVRHVANLGVQGVVSAVKDFAVNNYTPTIQVILLQGLAVDRIWQLTDELALFPPNLIPLYDYQVANREREVSKMISWGGAAPWKSFLSIDIYPQAALIRRYKTHDAIFKLTSDNHSAEIFSRPVPRDPKRHEIYDALSYLALAGPCGVVSAAEWSEMENGAALKRGMGGVWMERRIESLSNNTILPDVENMQIVVNSFDGFLGLPENVRKRLYIPLRRLNAAMRRHNLVDKAIELGVALEALLLGNGGSIENIALIFRLRGAFFLGGDSVDKRREIERLLNEVYSLRSVAVHTGDFSTKKTANADEVLTEGVALCRELILRIIALGRFPDWQTVVLGGEP